MLLSLDLDADWQIAFPISIIYFCFNNSSLGFKSSPHHVCFKHPSVVKQYCILFINDLRAKPRSNAMDASKRILTSRCDALVSEFTLKEKSLMFSICEVVTLRLDQIMIS